MISNITDTNQINNHALITNVILDLIIEVAKSQTGHEYQYVKSIIIFNLFIKSFILFS